MYQEEQLEKEIEEARRRREENEQREKLKQEESQQWSPSDRANSETDYGIEVSHPSGGSNKARSVKGASSKSALSPTARSSVPAARKPVAAPPTLVKRAAIIISNLRKLLEDVAISFKTNPIILIRTITFVVGLLVLLSRRDVKERIKKVMANGWNKVRATAGMGVKVTYI